MKSFNLIKTADKKDSDKKKMIGDGLSAAGGVASGVLLQENIPYLVNVLQGKGEYKTFSLPTELGLLGGSIAAPLLAKKIGSSDDEINRSTGIGVMAGALGKGLHRIRDYKQATKELGDSSEEEILKELGQSKDKIKNMLKQRAKLQGQTMGGIGTLGAAQAYFAHKAVNNSKKEQ